MAVDSKSETAVKATNLRGIVAVLQREGRLGRIVAAVSPEVGDLLRDPPASTAWIAFDHMAAIQRAIDSEFGSAENRRISRDAVAAGIVPLLQNMVGGLLRLFGSSPHTIISRLPDIMKVTTRGIEYRYTRVGDRACRVLVTFPHHRAITKATFESIAGGMESVFALCGVSGRVGAPSLVDDGDGNAANFELSW